MKVSHEAPICILSKVQKLVDYDYCLLHMLLQDEEYRNWFINEARKEHLILDNSAYELGAGLTGDKIVEGYDLIKPEYVVAPDVLRDAKTTNKNFLEFKRQFGDKVGKIGGVVQGRSYDELTDSLKFMFENADLVMIPAGIFNAGQERADFILKSIKEGNWREDKPVHLLGCRELTEYNSYAGVPNIVSTDTSSPVVYGLEVGTYPEDLSKYEKRKNMVDYKMQVTDEMFDNVEKNIKTFRNLTTYTREV